MPLGGALADRLPQVANLVAATGAALLESRIPPSFREALRWGADRLEDCAMERALRQLEFAHPEIEPHIQYLKASLAMLTLLPALLVLAGRRVFWPRVPRFTGEVPVEGKALARLRSEIGMAARKAFLTTKCFWSSVIVVKVRTSRLP